MAPAILWLSAAIAAAMLLGPRAHAAGLPDGVHRAVAADGTPSFSDAPLDRRTGLRRQYRGEYGREPAVAWCRGVATGTIEARGQALLPAFVEAGTTHAIDPQLLRAVARVESCFSPDAVSRTGAEGLMQLMPATARSLGVHDSFDARGNLEGGAAYLASLLVQYDNDLALALAAYNAGPGAVARHGGIPPFPETQRYVVKVQEQYERYRQDATSSSQPGTGSAARPPSPDASRALAKRS